MQGKQKGHAVSQTLVQEPETAYARMARAADADPGAAMAAQRAPMSAVGPTEFALSGGVRNFGESDFAGQLLDALRAMADRSKRRQADVLAALRGAGITAESRQVRAALRVLQAQGDIENLVPLSDGGLLLTVRPPRQPMHEGLSPLLPGAGAEDY